MSSSRMISVVVPAYNEQKLISASLRQIQHSLAVFDRLGWRHELIVCDNNSTDATAELARREGAQVVFEPVNQIARARNRGAQAAQGDWLIFIDADSHPSPALFERVARRIESGKYLGGGCTLRLDEHRPALVLCTTCWNLLSAAKGWAAGSFIFVQADAFRKLGGFSHELFVSEEIDFCKRLRKLARATGQTTTIIWGESILTSARKARLYSLREHLKFILALSLRPDRTMKTREACHPWYDGRR